MAIVAPRLFERLKLLFGFFTGKGSIGNADTSLYTKALEKKAHEEASIIEEQPSAEREREEPCRVREHVERSVAEILGDFQNEAWIHSDETSGPQPPSVVISKIQKISKLPTLSGIADRFRSLTTSEDQNAEEIAKLINSDPTLTTQVLKVASSAYYGGQANDSDISACVLRLGTDRIKMIASLLSGQSFLEEWDLKFKWRLLWTHSFATALLAQKVLEYFRLGPYPSLYSAALLHDVGKIILSYLYPGAYRNVLINAQNSGSDLKDLECHYFGIDHEEVGGVFAKLNKLPDEVCSIIRYHSSPRLAEVHQVQAAAVEIANLAAQRLNLGFSGTTRGIGIDFIRTPAWQCLSEHSDRDLTYVRDEQFDAFLEELSDAIREELEATFQN